MHPAIVRTVLVAALAVVVVRSAPAETLDTAGKQIYAGIAVVAAGAVIGVIFLVRHENHKTVTITGCVASGGVTDDKDKRVYTLTGDAVGVKPGNRMTLKGKRTGNSFEAHSVVQDLGGCHP